MARIAINDLQAKEKDLTAEEMNRVVGGAIYYRHWNQYMYRNRYVYRYVNQRKRVRVVQRVRYHRRNVTASGTNYGNWRMG